MRLGPSPDFTARTSKVLPRRDKREFVTRAKVIHRSPSGGGDQLGKERQINIDLVESGKWNIDNVSFNLG